MVDGMWCSFDQRQGRKDATANATGKTSNGETLGERFGRYWRGELRRGPSRSKDALRMTARTDNGKSEMRGFFAALRMTTLFLLRQNDNFEFCSG